MVKSISWFLHNTSTKNNLFTKFRSIMCFTEIISTKFHDGRDHTRVLPSATVQLDMHHRSSQSAHIMSATLTLRQCQFRPYFKNSASAFAQMQTYAVSCTLNCVGVCDSCHLIICVPKICFKRVAVSPTCLHGLIPYLQCSLQVQTFEWQDCHNELPDATPTG